MTTQELIVNIKTMATRNTTQNADRLHEGGGFSWTQQNLKHHELITSVAPPTGKASFERKGFGSAVTDLIYNVSNGSGQPIFTAYGDKSVDFHGNVYSMGGGNVLTNTAFGLGSLTANTTGTQSTSFGYLSQNLATTSLGNSSFGYQSAMNLIGTLSSSFGGNSLRDTTTGVNNNTFGYGSLQNNQTGSSNCVFGNGSTTATLNSVSVCAFGNGTLAVNSTPNSISAFGRNALASSTSGATNSSVFGFEACLSATANNISSFGYQNLRALTTGANNASFGHLGMNTLQTGSNNTSHGYRAGTNIGISVSNANLFGSQAGQGNTFNNVLVVGQNAVAAENNSISFGTATNPLTTITTETLTPTRTIVMYFNGQRFKLNATPA